MNLLFPDSFSHATAPCPSPTPRFKNRGRGYFHLVDYCRVCAKGSGGVSAPQVAVWKCRQVEDARRVRGDGRLEPQLLCDSDVGRFALHTAVQFNWLLKSGGALVYGKRWVKTHPLLRFTTQVHLLCRLSEVLCSHFPNLPHGL